MAEVRRLVDERPTYGYRRITALANREQARTGEPALNHKREFRMMRQNEMLLDRHTGRKNWPRPRWQGGRHALESALVLGRLRDNLLERRERRFAFIIDAHDREIIAWHAVASSGIGGRWSET